MTYQRKTYDEWELQLRTDYGWEMVTCETSSKEIRARKKEYLENAPGQYRIVKKRVPK